MMSAVVGVFEELQTAPGQVIPIGKVEDVNRKEVSIEGTVTQSWDADSSAIQQVGLIEDEILNREQELDRDSVSYTQLSREVSVAFADFARLAMVKELDLLHL